MLKTLSCTLLVVSIIASVHTAPDGNVGKPADVQQNNALMEVEKNELASEDKQVETNRVSGIEKVEKDELHMKSENANLEREISKLSHDSLDIKVSAGL